LRYHDRAFVDNAYRAILKRPPDATEFARDLKRIRSGEFNKIDLLSTLRYSNEGKAKGVELDGLTLPALMRQLGQLPIIGYFIRLAIAVARLPNQIRDQREFAGYVLSQQQQIADFSNSISARVEEMSGWVASLQHAHERLTGQLDAQKDETFQIETRIADRINSETELIQNQIEKIRVQAALLHDLVQKLERGSEFHLDPLYAALEERFRGSREEIKERLRVYLPYVEPVRGGLVIDLGSGRGEWLELMKEAEISAFGVEKNPVSIAGCRERGLIVVEDDVLALLRSAADASADAITGFHIIEHMPVETLVMLLDEVLRVLRPDGVAIFETPNPANVLVGSNFFYLDPTHKHPLPSELMKFLFDNRGFDRVEVLNLHQFASGRVSGEGELTERFNGLFYGPMDYAVLGYKKKA
jgi:O-antigen chain-terminating methyltransferase